MSAGSVPAEDVDMEDSEADSEEEREKFSDVLKFIGDLPK